MEIRAGRIFPGRVSVDILIVLDNSASMASKQEKVLKNLSKMMQVLQNLEGGMPDLHVGIVSTDLGAGMGEAGGDCAVPLGDRALLWGNDPSPGALATVAGGTSNGCGLSEGARWIESHPCPDGSGPAQNYRGELADVLTCMGRALGSHGCGYSHALQAAHLALDPQTGLNEANRGFLRPKGYLLIFFISDKDDCSAPTESTLNDGLFSARNPGESPFLRCAARGHVCDGQAIPNYHPSTGYDGTQGAWAFQLGGCAAKVPLDPPQASWLPLISVQQVVDGIRGLKQRPSETIFVAGIIGWPESERISQTQYRIDLASHHGLSLCLSRTEARIARQTRARATLGRPHDGELPSRRSILALGVSRGGHATRTSHLRPREPHDARRLPPTPNAIRDPCYALFGPGSGWCGASCSSSS